MLLVLKSNWKIFTFALLAASFTGYKCFLYDSFVYTSLTKIRLAQNLHIWSSSWAFLSPPITLHEEFLPRSAKDLTQRFAVLGRRIPFCRNTTVDVVMFAHKVTPALVGRMKQWSRDVR